MFFKQIVKSRVPDNRYRTFYSHSLAPKGHFTRWHIVSQPWDSWILALFPKYPPFYRTMYVRMLVSYIDAAHGQDPKPRWNALPPLREWKLSATLTVCRQHIHVEERQPEPVWEALQSQHVPFRLKESVIVARWRKLPVAQRLALALVLGDSGPGLFIVWGVGRPRSCL